MLICTDLNQRFSFSIKFSWNLHFAYSHYMELSEWKTHQSFIRFSFIFHMTWSRIVEMKTESGWERERREKKFIEPILYFFSLFLRHDKLRRCIKEDIKRYDGKKVKMKLLSLAHGRMLNVLAMFAHAHHFDSKDAELRAKHCPFSRELFV
jgi:hypothetical protein